MAHDDIVDMDPVQSGIDKGWHPALEKIDDDPARWRRLHIARADRGAGVDDDDRDAPGGHFARDQFGFPFG